MSTIMGSDPNAAAAAASTQAPEWVADLPEDLRGNETLKSFKGASWKEVGPALAKSFIETKSMTGRKAYDLPQQDWKPEQWQNWNKTIGVPESPDKYDPVDENLLKKTGLPPEVIANANKKFQEIGLTPRQVKGLLHDWYLPDLAKGFEMESAQRAESLKKDEAALRADWADKYDSNAGLVKAALAKYGSPELTKWADENGMANNPMLAKLFAKIGQELTESSGRTAGGGGGNQNTGKEAARAKITEIMSKRGTDREYEKLFQAYNSPELAQLQALYKEAY